MSAPISPNKLFEYGAFLRPEEALPDSVLHSDSFERFSEELDEELRRLEEAFADWTTRSSLKRGR